MKKLVTGIATMALAMALSAVSFAQQDQSAQPSAQTPSAQQPSSDTQTAPTTTDQQGTQPSAPSPDSSSSMQNTQGTSFTGTVVKAGGKYVLKTSDMNYQLDDQEKAKQFVGQQVKVNGSLDSNTSMIHISDISPLS